MAPEQGDGGCTGDEPRSRGRGRLNRWKRGRRSGLNRADIGEDGQAVDDLLLLLQELWSVLEADGFFARHGTDMVTARAVRIKGH